MSTTEEAQRSVLRAGGATVEVLYEGPDDARLLLTSDDATHGAPAGARLLCRAVHQARTRHTRRVRTVLDASAPAGAHYLAALRTRIGDDVAGIAMRRAGSSVLVTLDLMPPHRPQPHRRPGPA
jgi:hypothetical protein